MAGAARYAGSQMNSLRLVAFGAALALAVAGMATAYGWGYRAAMEKVGRAVAEAQRETIRAAEEASRIEEERLALEAERDALARQLEDDANAEPVAVPQCLGPSRLRRLNSR